MEAPNANAYESLLQVFDGATQGILSGPDELVRAFYPELKRLASARMRNSPTDHTWQPTVLVNEFYLELLKVRNLRPVHADNEHEKNAFFALAAQVMRWLLVRHTRPLSWQSEHDELTSSLALGAPGVESLAELDDLLEKLAAIEPQLRTVVELRVFEGLTAEEIATQLQCSSRTVTRHWKFAKVWLRQHLFPDVSQKEENSLG